MWAVKSPSWLKSAMQFTFPSKVENEESEAKVDIASTAQNLYVTISDLGSDEIRLIMLTRSIGCPAGD